MRGLVVAAVIWFGTFCKPKDQHWGEISLDLRARKKIRIARILWFVATFIYVIGVAGFALKFEMDYLAIALLLITGGTYLFFVYLGIDAWQEHLETVRNF
ncbi:MAG TPA: hypothetical protein DCZ54_01140 [Candidatus Vogelbacteria bacterium]|nr:hypothetical protein [Candidatus Vogelbacteria bacterium]